MNGYTLLLASDTLERDGMALELHDPDGNQVAEVFRDDDTGTRTFDCARLTIDPDVLSWFLDKARSNL